jgi:hypothetical protein
MDDTQLIKLFCKTLETKYLDKLSTHTQNTFEKMACYCIDEQIGNHKVAKIVINHFENICFDITQKHKTDAITITFGDQAENHAGMQKIGIPKNKGFTVSELRNIKELMESMGCVCELIDLTKALDGLPDLPKIPPAKVLIIRGIFDTPYFKEYSPDKAFKELKSFKWDTYLVNMRRKVIQNKLSRANMCVSNSFDIPEYTEDDAQQHLKGGYWQHENLSSLYKKQEEYKKIHTKLPKELLDSAKGTVLKWRRLPVLNTFKYFIEKYFGEPAKNLVAEGNSYVELNKCGIGFHGDTERHIVIGIRFGKPFPMHFNWYHQFKQIGKRIILPQLNQGDVYIMSEKAVGSDWMAKGAKHSLTIRHAAGCAKYTKYK